MIRKPNPHALQLTPPVPNMGSCLATHRITVDGMRVGFMYRDLPTPEITSGWRFLASDESEEYLNNLDHSAVCLVNTIGEHDRAIIPFLDAPYGSLFVRDAETNNFVRGDFQPGAQS